MELFDTTGITSLQSAMAYQQTHCNQEMAIIPKLQFANELYERFGETGNLEDLNAAIGLFREVIANLPLGREENTVCLNNLANALNMRFDQTGRHIDLDEAISLHRQSLELLDPSHPEWSTSLNNLASALDTRYEQGGQQSDIDEAISLHRKALALRPSPHPLRCSSLNNLASALNTRFEQGGPNSDLDEAISLHRHALELRPLPHPLRCSSLSNLANTLNNRFEQGGQESDLDEAISLYRQALELLPPDRSTFLNNLANALNTRFEQGGQNHDLCEAISLHRQALELRPHPHSHRSSSLNNLANALNTKFEQGGQNSDLDEAIILHRQALTLRPLPHPLRCSSLNNLANALETHFEQGGRHSDLDEAISLHRQALELRSPPHPLRCSSLNNLANALNTRFEQGGQNSDLDEAILLHRQALELRPQPHPLRCSSLNNLASALNARFEQGGQNSDLDEAICLHRQVLEMQHWPHPDHSRSLNNLANALTNRFEQRDQNNDIDEAIALYRRALELHHSSHPRRSISLTNLANALNSRFGKGGQDINLDEAISLYRQALELQPPPHPDRSSSLNNLATALNARFEQGGQNNDLNEAVTLHRQALDLRPSPHPDRSSSLHNLPHSLGIRFEHRSQQSDLDEAISLLCTATQYRFQPPSKCLYISKQWIHTADQNGHDSLISAYEAALRILPQVAALSLTVELRQKALISRSDGLARDASRCAILMREITKAIEFLEAGRSIFWSQVISLRSPFDQLRDVAPDGSVLADRLQAIAQELENGSHRKISFNFLDNFSRLSIDRESSRLNRLTEEWEEIVLRARNLHGLEDFLLPPRISSLQSAASMHPVVLLIANSNESHCLIMTSTVISHIPLPRLHSPILKVLVENVRMASSSSISRLMINETHHTITQILGKERGISYQNNSGDSDGIFRFVLKLLWDELVKPIIDRLDIKKHSDDISTLQWCPTGHFTFLPIHAAGIYDPSNSVIDCAQDYFISSYTPTIGILVAKQSLAPSQRFKMMAVIESQELHSTTLELHKIRGHVPDDALITLGVPGSPACVEVVASQLSDVSIVHFACHGYQEPSKPLDSWLKLGDGQLRISRIMKENLPNGALAFLSACETAMGDESLPDEAMSLAASLLFSGFRRVIATMWMMMDADGPAIADTFYRELFRGPDGEKMSVPDVAKSAYALHVAVKELRSSEVSFRRWVPFIHMGQC